MRWLGVVAQAMVLLPVGAVLWYRAPMPYRIIAGAWAVSWLGDEIMRTTGGFEAVYAWQAVQVGLVLWALARSVAWRVAIIAGIPMLAAAAGLYTWPGPDLIVTVVGSSAILWSADGPIAVPLYLYFGLGTVLYLAMINAHHASADPLLPWLGYQGCRLAAFVAFTLLLRRRAWAT